MTLRRKVGSLSLPSPLPLTFHSRDAESLAVALLGKRLVHVVRGRPRVGRIVETEAYVGPYDLACHASKGRTKRTEVMFGPPGHAYLFLVYGMHVCMNVVVGGGAAVLLRGVAPEEGLEGVVAILVIPREEHDSCRVYLGEPHGPAEHEHFRIRPRVKGSWPD